MKRLLRPRTFLVLLSLLPLAALSTACSGHSDDGGQTTVPPGETMNTANPRFGTMMANNLFRAISVSTRIDPSNIANAAVNTRFSQVKLNLSYDGKGSGGTKKAAADLALQFCDLISQQDAAKQPSDPTKIHIIDLNSGFGTKGSDGTWSLFGPVIQKGWVKDLMFKLTGEPATDARVGVLLDAIATYIPLLTNDAAGKQTLATLTCAPITAIDWY